MGSHILEKDVVQLEHTIKTPEFAGLRITCWSQDTPPGEYGHKQQCHPSPRYPGSRLIISTH